MPDPFGLNQYFAPKRVVIQPRPETPPSTALANPNTLMQLADLLKATQARRAAENAPQTPPVTVPSSVPNYGALAGPQGMGAATPGINPAAPPVAMPPSGAGANIGGMVGSAVGQSMSPPNYGALAAPQNAGAAMPPPVPPQAAAPMPAIDPSPQPVNPAPPVAPGSQGLPAMSAPIAINGPGPGANGQQAISTSIWDTWKKMFANGQVPEGYRGAMGEMIKNG